MSGYLTSLKINNLQTQLDGAILAQGFVNPLQIDLIGNGKNITGLGSLTGVDCNFTNMTTTNLQTSGNVTVPSLTCTGIISGNNITAIGGNPLSISANPSSYLSLNPAGRTITGIISPSQVLANTNCGQQIRQISDANDVNSIQVLISQGVVGTNYINTFNSNNITCGAPLIFAEGQEYGDVVCTGVTSSGPVTASGLVTANAGLTIAGPTVSNGSIKTTDYIITDAIESVEGNTGTINIESTANFNYPVNFQTDTTFTQTVTVPNLIMGAGGVINGDPTNLYTMNNVGELNARNLRATGNVTALTALASPALGLGGAYPITLQSNNTLNAAGYPALQLAVLKNGTTVVNSLVYDTVFNPPPSVTANTLAGVLTAGNNANLQNILGIQTLQTNQIQASGGGLITIEDTVTADSTITATGLLAPVLTLTGATATGINYNSPYLQVKPASQTVYGNVYDSVYNKPPGGPSVAFPPNVNNIAAGGDFNTIFTDPNGAIWYAPVPVLAWTIPSTSGPFNNVTMTANNFTFTSNMGSVGELYLYITTGPTNFPSGCGGGSGIINDHSLIINTNGAVLSNILLSSTNATAGNIIYIMVCSSIQGVATQLGFTFQGIQFTFEQTPVLTLTFDPA